MFWQQTKQVVLTYVTLKWFWFILGAVLLMTSVMYATVGGKGINAANGLGMPVVMGMTWVVMIAKWQFANPRARLLPGYAGPHLAVLSILMLVVLLANPVCLAAWADASIPGSLAFTLLLGAAFSWGTQPGRNLSILPGMAVFFSGMTKTGMQFWFVTPNRFDALHWTLAGAGGAMVVAWLRHLSNLTEEMDDYQVLPIGGPMGGASRMERAESRKLLGKMMARRGIMQFLADRWHDQLENLQAGPESRPQLMHYGFGRISGVSRAVMFGLGFALYGVFLNQLFSSQLGGSGSGFGMMGMTVQWAMVIPAGVAGLMMMQRLPRMAQELLRPTTRAEYIDGLFLTLAKQSFWLWVAVQIGMLAIAISTAAFPDENLPRLATFFSLVSLAAHVPTFGFTLWLVRKFSIWRTILGLYAVMAFNALVLNLWWAGRKEWGDPLIVTLIVVVLVALGAKMIAWARSAWLRLELG